MKPMSDITPLFIEGDAGKLFTLHYAPKNNSVKSECFIVAASFAEEMNRCRYMGTLLAQSLSKLGYGFLVVDAYGTGDSAGDFQDASWEQSCRDLITGIEYAKILGYQQVSLLGVRLGALQAIRVASEVKEIKRLIMWQPVINGQAALTQFLRIKIAASINRNEKPGKIKDFEAQIDRNENLSVAGYDMSANYFKGIRSANFNNYIEFNSSPICWFTILGSADRKTPQGDLKLIEKWRKNGAVIDHREIIGSSFWQAHERTLVPELIDETIEYVTGAD